MEPRALLRPVGPHPAAVYWRRRLVVLAVVLVCLFVLRAVAGGGEPPHGAAGAPTTGATPRSGASAASAAGAATPDTAGTSAPATGAGATGAAGRAGAAAAAGRAGASRAAPPGGATAPCRAGDLALSVATDSTSYASGATPRLLLTVTATGRHPCRVDVGTAARSFVIRSGEDRIWSSADCAAPGHAVATFAPHQRVAYAVTWSRHRSAPGCPSGAATAALPGTYRVTGNLGRLSSDEAVFSLADG